MEKRKRHLSISIIYWMTQIIFWLFVVVFFGAFVANVLLHTVDIGNTLQIHTDLPSKASYTEKGTLTLFGEIHKVEFLEASGKVHFIDTDQYLAKWFGGLLIGVVSVSLFIILAFKRFIGNVYRGLIFERYNIRMLKNMAYGLIIFWGFMVFYSRMFYFFIARHLSFEHIKITDEINSYGFLLFIALFLWVLSHIFMLGVKMQEEQNYTV